MRICFDVNGLGRNVQVRKPIFSLYPSTMFRFVVILCILCSTLLITCSLWHADKLQRCPATSS